MKKKDENSTEIVKAGENSQQSPATEVTNNMVHMIEQVALNPDVPVDKMERMLDMQFKMLDRQAEQDFAGAMVRTQIAMPNIKKNSTNDHTHSGYADLEQVNRAVIPVYTAEGFSLSFGTTDSPLPGCIRVICDVSHISGHSKERTYDSPIDECGPNGKPNKSKAHASASAVSYGKRYLTAMIFNLTYTNEDDDGNAAVEMEQPKITSSQCKKIEKMIDDYGIDKKAFLEFGKLEKISDLIAVKLNSAIAWIKKAGGE